MRDARVFYKKKEAGRLTQLDDGSFVFRYLDQWFDESSKPAVSLTLAKTQQEYRSDFLFPCFYNMLPEGSNKQTVCFENRLDLEDHFGILLTTARHDTIGAIQILKVESNG
ncbi:HipA N-terminal domain-containing protein [Nonlabens antarcticus]|uniref:HipA N-terminal domain-containing protein n=1 Tax=Nonlabens antarcticus TaxID=392714 RepID=UPI00189134DA|nr:HipA N-terminal domain-containing protein [Nonlabens antarcticus]